MIILEYTWIVIDFDDYVINDTGNNNSNKNDTGNNNSNKNGKIIAFSK